ncbi:MAG TPA: hypothetical protein PKA41_16335 [Verrucomicrobiota bacterium]|nr:hypothetical protein [Verrucomicrobiota bacterium]
MPEYATTSPFGFSPCGPPWWRRTRTAPVSPCEVTLATNAVAQIGNLLYRRLAVGSASQQPTYQYLATPRRLPTCDTAD